MFSVPLRVSARVAPRCFSFRIAGDEGEATEI
jgi:hypothetical protein